MATINEKLYPPTIEGILPAFYKTDEGAVITVPFLMNRAVSFQAIDGFALKIKTIQTGKLIATITATKEAATMKDNQNGEISFNIENDSELMTLINEGQFFKVQLAYYTIEANAEKKHGYYSTVGIIKCTKKPQVYLKWFKEDSFGEQVIPFLQDYIGVYENEDQSEKLYSYNFSLYDENKNLIETSDWQLHDNSGDQSLSNSYIQSNNSYTFYSALEPNKYYYLQYAIRTINGLEEKSPLYKFLNVDTISLLPLKLTAENIFDDGYIKINCSLTDSAQESEPSEPVTVRLYRSDSSDDFCSQIPLKTQTLNPEPGFSWTFNDFFIQQGVIYRYYLKQKINNIWWSTVEESAVTVCADFEDMFLWDGQKHIKIRFNPKVPSFKSTRLEQKTDTIGNQYPVFFRNGMVNYKEFSISGLISYHMDNDNIFNINKASTFQIQNFTSTDLVGENIYKERQFKLHLLDWLNDGNVKMFKSPVEGNYLVRLTNVSLTPEDKLNRMIHSFSCNACEVEELSYKNLINLNFEEKISDNVFNNNIVVVDNKYISPMEAQQRINSLLKQKKNIIQIILTFGLKEEIEVMKLSEEDGTYLQLFNHSILYGLDRNFIYKCKISEESDEGYLINNNGEKLESPIYQISFTTQNENIEIGPDDDQQKFPLSKSFFIINTESISALEFSYPLYVQISYVTTTAEGDDEA